MAARERLLTIRVTNEELETIHKVAHFEGKPASDLLRNTVLDHYEANKEKVEKKWREKE